jgi:hypothetical protein
MKSIAAPGARGGPCTPTVHRHLLALRVPRRVRRRWSTPGG